MGARRLSGGGADTTAPPLVTPAAAAASAGGTFTTTTTNNSNSSGGGNGGSFDANMVIILAALLCVLIFALGLNSLVRCCLHCARRLSSSSSAPSSSSSPAPAPAGLKRKALRRIPVEVYGASNGVTAEGRAAAAECAICLGEFAGGEKVRVLPRCRHGFHVRCIDAWLAAHSSCPNCRASLLVPDPGAAAGAGEDGARGRR